MIQLPRRSVTRFFIPLIDVLTLLFCIFLLMPIVKPSDVADQQTGPLDAREREELERLRQELRRGQSGRDANEAERQELERLRKEKIKTLQERLFIRVLEIDPDSGKLFHYDPDRVEIRTEADARSLIERQKREAANAEIYYLFLYPRRGQGFPEKKQLDQYLRWFADVAHGIDNPHAGG
jgi:hypothetical protein